MSDSNEGIKFWYTRKQLQRMMRGKEVRYRRNKVWHIAGMKVRHKKIELSKALEKIATLEKRLKDAGIK